MFLLIAASSQAQLVVTSTDTMVCVNDTVWIEAMGYDSITWSCSATLSSDTGMNVYVTGTGVHLVTIKGYNSGATVASDSFLRWVEFAANPIFMVSGGALTEMHDCATDTISMEACFSTGLSYTFIGSGADEYIWTGFGANNVAGDTFVVTATVGTNYIKIIGIDTANTSLDTLFIRVTINPLPTGTITTSAASDNNFICLGGSATLSLATLTGNSVSWMPIYALDTAAGTVVVATPDSTVTYTAVITTQFGCEAAKTQIVQVGKIDPVFNLSLSPLEICPGDSTLITATGVGPISKFEWSPATTLSSSTGNMVMAGPSVTTTYTVTATRFGCNDQKTIIAIVLPPPPMTTSQSSNGAPIALDQTDVVTVNCPTCLSYVWKLPSAVLQTTSNVQSISPNEPGIHPIIISGKDSNECRSTRTVTITVDDRFIGEPFPPLAISELDEAQFLVKQNGASVEIQSGSPIEFVEVYNLLGEKIVSLNGNQNTQVSWNHSQFATGMYIIKAKSTKSDLTKKIYLN